MLAGPVSDAPTSRESYGWAKDLDHCLIAFARVFDLWRQVNNALIDLDEANRAELVANDASRVMKTLGTPSFWKRFIFYSTVTAGFVQKLLRCPRRLY